MALTATNVLDIIRLKGSVIIDSSLYSPSNLLDFARVAASTEAHITFKNCSDISATTLLDIVRIAKKSASIDLT